MSGPNGSTPLHLTARERAEILRRAGINAGWVLMSVSEMHNLKKQMDGCSAENERLNKQTAKFIARKLVMDQVAVKTLQSARSVLATIADRDAEPAMRVEAIREVAHIDEALSILPKYEPENPKVSG